MPGERNPPSTAEEFAPPPQGESVLDASVMAELIVTKKEIGSQFKKSAGTPRPGRKSTARVVNDCRRREDMGPSILCFGSWVWGALLVAGFAVSVRTLIEGKIRADTAAWTRVIQGHSQDRRHGKRQRCVPAGLDMACGALGSDATRRSSSQSSCSFRNANFDLPIC